MEKVQGKQKCREIKCRAGWKQMCRGEGKQKCRGEGNQKCGRKGMQRLASLPFCRYNYYFCITSHQALEGPPCARTTIGHHSYHASAITRMKDCHRRPGRRNSHIQLVSQGASLDQQLESPAWGTAAVHGALQQAAAEAATPAISAWGVKLQPMHPAPPRWGSAGMGVLPGLPVQSSQENDEVGGVSEANGCLSSLGELCICIP